MIHSYGLCGTTIYKRLRTAKRGGEGVLRGRRQPGRESSLVPRQSLGGQMPEDPTGGRCELRILPAYMPELSLDDAIWNELKGLA